MKLRPVLGPGIEHGEDLRYVPDFLERHHRGPLPEHVGRGIRAPALFVV